MFLLLNLIRNKTPFQIFAVFQTTKPRSISTVAIFSGRKYFMNNGSPLSKRPCTMTKKIGTHDGAFHCDEVLACALLKKLPEYADALVIRTRDPSKLAECDIVVDVGGIYDPHNNINRYDHHQRTFKESMNTLKPEKKWVTRLSSAGLVYCHFGHKIINIMLGSNAKGDDSKTERLFDKLYENFVEEIDAIDNGISTHDGQPRYLMTTNLSSRVGYLNPHWNESNVDVQERFEKAMKLVEAEFRDRLHYYSDVWWPARECVFKAIQNRFDVDASGEVVDLGEGGCPWKDHLMDIEEQEDIKPNIKFLIFGDQSGDWRVQCVPVCLGSFQNRLSLLEKWQGLRDEELSKVSGISDCVFVHASGFIGGNKTREGALQMAQQTLNAK